MAQAWLALQRQMARRRDQANRRNRSGTAIATVDAVPTVGNVQNRNRRTRRSAANQKGGRKGRKMRRMKTWLHGVIVEEQEEGHDYNEHLLSDTDEEEEQHLLSEDELPLSDDEDQQQISFQDIHLNNINNIHEAKEHHQDDDILEWQQQQEQDWKTTVQRDLCILPKSKSYQDVSTPSVYVSLDDYLSQTNIHLDASYSTDVKQIGNGISIFKLPILSPQLWIVTVIQTLTLFVDMTYSSFFLPSQVVFHFFNRDSLIWNLIIYVSSLVFAADLITGFQVGFYHRHGTQRILVMDGNIIAQKEVRNWQFFVDIISVLPMFLQISINIDMSRENSYHTIGTTERIIQQVMEIMLLTRLVHVFRVIRRLFSQCYKGDEGAYVFIHSKLLSVVVLGYASAVVANIFGCIWFAAAVYNHGAEDTWVSERGIADASKGTQWLTSIYWAVVTATTIGYGDISATNDVEELVAVVLMILSVICFAIIITIATDLFQSSERATLRAERFRQKMVQVRAWIRDYHLPKQLAQEISNFYGVEWLYNKDLDDSTMFDELPELLAGKVAVHMTTDFLPHLEIFEELEENQWKNIAMRMTPMTLLPGSDIFREPSLADAIYFIQEGEVQVSRCWQHVDYLIAPDFFAENHILDGKSTEKIRMMSLICNSECRIWRLDVLDLKTILMNMPYEVTKKIKRGIRKRNYQAAINSIPKKYLPGLLRRIQEQKFDDDEEDEEELQQVENRPYKAPQIPQIERYWEAVTGQQEESRSEDNKLVTRELLESRIFGPTPPYL
eukprot:TRINITY_DN1906_c1_g1_i1.p1 TRINITY_DN1906_c1_g1~~TRINITY_DN1906_c1_g1_i1.p1  ORF type:complete len:782 (-),score=97.32 TRINITY_DN1906_c1_g1_i1:2891-5236(-)